MALPPYRRIRLVFQSLFKPHSHSAATSEHPACQPLRELGTRVVIESGEPVSVETDNDASDQHLELILGCEQVEKVALNWCYRVTDAGIRKLAGLVHLRELVLRGADITGAGLSAFAGHSALESLDLDGSGITDESLADVARIPHLRSLSLRYTDAGNRGVELLKGASRLEVLHLDGTPVTGDALPDVRCHDQLQVLSLPAGIQGRDLFHLSGFGSLRFVWLSDASVDNESIRSLRETLNPVCFVSWRHAQRSGRTPRP